MMLREKFAQRFEELEHDFRHLPSRIASEASDVWYIESADWKRWATSVQNLLRPVFGIDSPHYTNFLDSFKNCGGYSYEVEELHGLFLSAKADFEGGYVFDVDLRISGEIFGDFVLLAKQSLDEGHLHVAAVLAAAALEDTLKRYGVSKSLDVSGKSMQEVINALKSAGHVAGAQKSLLEFMPRFRNDALHANWEKLTQPDVASVIGFVEQFLLTRFGEG